MTLYSLLYLIVFYFYVKSDSKEAENMAEWLRAFGTFA